MPQYTLSINIKSDNKEMLDNLMVTLETIHGDLSEVSAVELFSTCDSSSEKNPGVMVLPAPSTTQRNLFLDKWTLSDPI